MHSETILGFKRVRACMFGGFAKFVPLKLQANRRESVRILVANLSVFQCIAAALPDMLHISLVIWTNLKVPRWERGSQFKTWAQEGFTCLCPCCREEYHCIPNLWQAAKNLISFELKKKKKNFSRHTCTDSIFFLPWHFLARQNELHRSEATEQGKHTGA